MVAFCFHVTVNVAHVLLGQGPWAGFLPWHFNKKITLQFLPHMGDYGKVTYSRNSVGSVGDTVHTGLKPIFFLVPFLALANVDLLL